MSRRGAGGGDQIARLATLPEAARDRMLRSLTIEQRRELNARWTRWAHDRFALIDADAVRTIDLPLSAIGGTVRVMASGVGDGAGPVEVSVTIGGASVLPPSPVHVGYAIDESGEAIVTWTRRSRAGWRWIDGVDAPLAEEAEAYRVTIGPAAAPIRVVETPAPSISLSAADRTGGIVRVSIAQRGTFGESPAAIIDVPGS